MMKYVHIQVGSLPLMKSIIWCVIAMIGLWLCFLVPTSLEANSELQIPTNVMCACQNEVLIFNCTTVGGGATIWEGSAFQCPTGEIILRHNAFSGDNPQSGDCAGIVGESIGIQGDCYTSRLRVPISAQLNNRTVRCLYNSDTMTLIREARISVVTGPYQQAPTRVRISQVNSREFTVSWIPFDTNCPSIDYSINYPCGTCRVTTETTAICSDLQLPSNCTLSIQSVICEHVGAGSTPIRVLLRVPDKPKVDVIPVYSADSQILIGFRVTVDQEASFLIASGISGAVTTYNLSYSQGTLNFPRNSICEGSCKYVVNIPTSVCSSSPGAPLDVTLSASNILGQGPPSNTTTIGCMNQFVQVKYNSTMSAIVCTFLDQTDSSVKSCTVMYGQCDGMLTYTSQGNSTSAMNTPNRIALNVDGERLDCYVVIASNAAITVVVNGTRMTTAGNINVVAAVVAPIAVFVILITTVLIVLVIVIKLRRKDTGDPHRQVEAYYELQPTEKKKIITKLKLQPLSKKNFQIGTVEDDCELREFVTEKLKCEYDRGRAFYQFEHTFERILESDDKRIIFMGKNNEFFSPGLTMEELKEHHLVGDKVSRPDYSYFKVFVQSTGLGARHLISGTQVLYQKQDHSQQRKQLRPILSKQFKLSDISSNAQTQTINDFREKQKLPLNRCNVFLELKDVTIKQDKDLIDVILMDDNTKQLFSGPFARDTARDVVRRSSGPGKWRVFVLCKFNESMVLRPGTQVLHQDPECTSEEFYELIVDVDNVRMSTFIEQKGYKFINGHIFYEFSGKEDLLCYKEVVHAYQKKNEKKFLSSTDLFYAIQGAPSLEINPPVVGGFKIFLQSTSQGSRCLKKGTTVLCKKVQQSYMYRAYESVYSGVQYMLGQT